MKNIYLPKIDKSYLSESKIRIFFTMQFFLFKSVFSRVSTYFSLLIGMFVSLFSFLLPVIIGFKPEEFLAVLKVFFIYGAATLVFFSSFLGASVGLELFSEPQRNGSELIIISKPISRFQIVFSRIFFFFVICLICSLLSLCTVLISGAIINASVSLPENKSFFQTNYWSVAVIGGIFLASFLGFLTFGLIGSFFSIKFYFKTARVLATSIITGSYFITIIMLQVQPAIQRSTAEKLTASFVPRINNYLDQLAIDDKTLVDLSQDSNQKLNNFVVSKFVKDSKKLVNSDGKINFSVFDFSYLNPNKNIYFEPVLDKPKRSYFQNAYNPKEKITLYMPNYPNWDPEQDEYRQANKNVNAPSKQEYESWYTKKLKIYDENIQKLSFIVSNSLKNLSVPAHGTTAISYLNPFSAFISITNLTDKSIDEETYKSTFKKRVFLPNYSYKISSLISKDNLNNCYLSLISEKKTQLRYDPVWALILWILAIDLIVFASVIFVYKRKDFY